MAILLDDVFKISDDFWNHQSSKITENTQFSYLMGEIWGYSALINFARLCNVDAILCMGLWRIFWMTFFKFLITFETPVYENYRKYSI